MQDSPTPPKKKKKKKKKREKVEINQIIGNAINNFRAVTEDKISFFTFWQTFGGTFGWESQILIFELLLGLHNILTAAVQVFARTIQEIEGYWA